MSEAIVVLPFALIIVVGLLWPTETEKEPVMNVWETIKNFFAPKKKDDPGTTIPSPGAEKEWGRAPHDHVDE